MMQNQKKRFTAIDFFLVVIKADGLCLFNYVYDE